MATCPRDGSFALAFSGNRTTVHLSIVSSVASKRFAGIGDPSLARSAVRSDRHPVSCDRWLRGVAAKAATEAGRASMQGTCGEAPEFVGFEGGYAVSLADIHGGRLRRHNLSDQHA